MNLKIILCSMAALISLQCEESMPDIRMPLLLCINGRYAKAESYLNSFYKEVQNDEQKMVLHLLKAYIQEKLGKQDEADKYINEVWKAQYDLFFMETPLILNTINDCSSCDNLVDIWTNEACIQNEEGFLKMNRLEIK